MQKRGTEGGSSNESLKGSVERRNSRSPRCSVLECLPFALSPLDSITCVFVFLVNFCYLNWWLLNHFPQASYFTSQPWINLRGMISSLWREGVRAGGKEERGGECSQRKGGGEGRGKEKEKGKPFMILVMLANFSFLICCSFFICEQERIKRPSRFSGRIQILFFFFSFL